MCSFRVWVTEIRRLAVQFALLVAQSEGMVD
jgi:hypothetical protein